MLNVKGESSQAGEIFQTGQVKTEVSIRHLRTEKQVVN